jgi:anti-sigma regulatory factor (Ser/Thr protein kinase)
MSHGQPRVPVLQGGWCGGHEPPPIRPPQLLSSALLPAARWVSRQTASCQLDPGSASRTAREFTGQTLRGWGLLALADDVMVIVSELVSNALRHGRDGVGAAVHDRVELILWRRSGEVVCAVTDPGAQVPVMAEPDPLAEAGRGLHVVEALSATWGWTRLSDRRKAVWAALAMPQPETGQAGRAWPA